MMAMAPLQVKVYNLVISICSTSEEASQLLRQLVPVAESSKITPELVS